MEEKLIIFYTDDDEDDLEFFKKAIQSINSDYTVMTYTNGNQLLNALDNPPPNPYLLFLDINMPGMNGIQLLEAIRKSEKHGQLPVVMFSTTQDELVVQKTKELGANYYLPKAANFTKLKESIEHALKINWEKFTPDSNNFLYNKL